MTGLDDEIGPLLRAQLRAEDRKRGFVAPRPSRYMLRMSGCAGKEAFPDRATADRTARSVGRRHDRQRFDVYRCRFCGRWHVGTLARDAKKSSQRSRE